METALKLVSWLGRQKEKTYAVNIKSHSNARKLAPFLDEEGKPLTWVNWSKPKIGTNKKTKPHFRHYPVGKEKTSKRYVTIDEEIEDKEKISESILHRTAKEALLAYLQKLVEQKSSLKWAYKDDEISDFALTGDLLYGVESIQKEYRYKTPFLTKEYRFDIALLGRKLGKEPIILGVIEIEKENKFGLLKCLICKSLGFPLISINIEELTIDDITQDWCEKVLRETTENSEDGLRRNYIYIHNALYPIYTNIPNNYRRENKHQYIIFSKENEFDKLIKLLEGYRDLLQIPKEQIHIDKPTLNKDNPQSLKMFENEGSIAGKEWADYNKNRYIRLTLEVPKGNNYNLYFYHLVIARLLNAHFETLVGYKYSKGVTNNDIDNLYWSFTSFNKVTRIIQKQMSEPMQPVIDYLQECGIYEKILKK